jgi:hypothetical protein
MWMYHYLIIRAADKVVCVTSNGRIHYPGIDPSIDWRMTGAVQYGRGSKGHMIVRRYDMLAVWQRRVPWFYKNGKPRCHVTDLCHGNEREWRDPPVTSVRVMYASRA